jgi:hypothetical protein
MTKKHFISLAAMFKAERPQPHWDGNKLTVWNALVVGTADVCRQTNPRFDRERFITACGGLFDMNRRAA